jgi:hypothetical protein
MSSFARRIRFLILTVLLLGHAKSSWADGARLFKSGPIQITADGRWVWVANEDNDSVSRIDTTNDAVLEIPLPNPGTSDRPRGLSVTEDGSEVWVACHDSDRVVILDGSNGAMLDQIDLPWGSGPHSAAISRDQSTALVTLHRAAGVAVIDVVTRSVTHILEPTYWSPAGIAWTEDGESAWVTHLFAPGEHPLISRIDFSGPDPELATSIQVFATGPRQSSALTAPFNIAEGGYLTTRGHLAQIPSATGRQEVWLPTQYNAINEDTYSPDSTTQSTVRHVDLATNLIPNTNSDKVILTAVHVHDPAGNNPYVGPGWNAQIAGPIDIAFSTDGSETYLLHELSNNLASHGSEWPRRHDGISPLRLADAVHGGDRRDRRHRHPRRDAHFTWRVRRCAHARAAPLPAAVERSRHGQQLEQQPHRRPHLARPRAPERPMEQQRRQRARWHGWHAVRLQRHLGSRRAD